MNIRLEYLYRDAGNYKKWGEVIFSNSEKMPIDGLRSKFLTTLIQRMYFSSKELQVPDLRFDDYLLDLDHDWHEFSDFSETDEPPTDVLERSILQFIQKSIP